MGTRLFMYGPCTYQVDSHLFDEHRTAVVLDDSRVIVIKSWDGDPDFPILKGQEFPGTLASTGTLARQWQTFVARYALLGTRLDKVSELVQEGLKLTHISGARDKRVKIEVVVTGPANKEMVPVKVVRHIDVGSDAELQYLQEGAEVSLSMRTLWTFPGKK